MYKNYIFYSLLSILLLVSSAELNSQSFENGEIAVTLSGAGRIRIFKNSLTSPRQIDRSSILVGTGPNAVFGYNQDAINAEPVINVTNPQFSDFEIYGAADNNYNNPPRPPHVLSKVNIYGWQTGGYILVKYRILNKEPNLMNAVIGMEVIPQVNGSYGLETIRWIDDQKIMSIYRIGESGYTGYKLLSAQVNSVTMIDWYAGYDTVDADLWNWITTGVIDTLLDSGGDGSVNFFSQSQVSIPIGDSAYFWVGISVGNDESEMIANMQLAEQKYNLISAIEPESGLTPSEYTLEQNFPNPFNPETSIRFSIPVREFVSLKIFNSLGQEVVEVISRELEQGSYNYKFNAMGLTSGVYFYSLKAGSFTQTKKMILLR